MLLETLRDPRAGAAHLLRLGFSPLVGWMALLLMAVASTILTHLSLSSLPPEAREAWAGLFGGPVRTAMLQWVVLLVSVHAIYRVGAWRGGTGTLNGAVVLVAWLQFILLLFQIAQLLADAILPPLAGVLGTAGMVAFFWLLTNFIAQLHGFKSLAMTFLGVLITSFVAVFLLSIVITLLVGVPSEGV
ncbi:Yip1 family protein [Pseudorhodobacter antarcticus]|nr:Yip1 family protein [Pseudorhodobacter antarcticus]